MVGLTCYRLVVCSAAIEESAPTKPLVLKSYHNKEVLATSVPEDTEIWAIARAVLAVPSYLKPIKIAEMILMDGSIFYPNPTLDILREVEKDSDTSDDVAVISIGAGTNLGAKSGTMWPSVFRNTAQSTPARDVHQQMTLLSVNGQRFPYYRLDVEEGLESFSVLDWKDWQSGNLQEDIEKATYVYSSDFKR